MNTITISAYILAGLFIIFLTRATIKVIRKNNREKKLTKLHKDYEKKEKELKRKGLKKFTFNQGKTIVWALDFKSANLQYQASRKNGK